MYTKQSIILKSDFYSRFGETQGAMYFEKTGFPCAILDSGSNSLLFSARKFVYFSINFFK